MSQDPWEVDDNPLDLNDGMVDRVHVPIAFTQATTLSSVLAALSDGLDNLIQMRSPCWARANPMAH